MTDLPTIEARLATLKNAAEGAGVVVILASVSYGSGDAGPPTVDLEADQFIAAMQQLTPAALYLDEKKFDAEYEIRGLLRSSVDDEHDLTKNRTFPILSKMNSFHKLMQRWKKNDGILKMYSACFICHGIIHESLDFSEWYGEFIEEFRTLEAERQSEIEKHIAADEADERRPISERAAILAASPQFNAKRPSKAKRIFLAERLFPDMSRAILNEIVAEAENLFWFENNGDYPNSDNS